jgi:hypothetical protein
MLGGAPPLLSKSTSPTVSKFARDEGYFCPVRWKLLIITSIVAALLNAGGMRALAHWGLAFITPPGAMLPGLSARGAVVPLLFTALACVFVYRHTARRRKLQAALTALFALVLTLAALFLARAFI